MDSIQNEQAFRDAISALPLERQRHLGARFVRRVLPLSTDFRLLPALEAAERPVVNDGELANAYKSARSAAVETYTACGRAVDWKAMAAHHVAEAVAACAMPTALVEAGAEQPAYEAAMSARMARSCSMLADEQHGDCPEITAQYAVLDEFLAES